METEKINLLLVDDEELLRQGIRSLLEKESFVAQIFEAANAKECHSAIVNNRIDIVLLDVKLPGVRGTQIMEDLNKSKSRPKVIIVTGLEGVELIINLLKSGANGIVFKLNGYSEIINAIKGILKTGNYFQERILKIIQINAYRWDKVPSITLSYLENELLRAIANGLTTKAIAGQLKMTEATTETYRIRLIRKMGMPNTAALLAYAFNNGIL